MATIVISYRRDDSKWIAGRIFDRLEGHYGKGSVFMDIDSIPLGLDFREHLRETLARCDVLLAVVGPNWLGRTAAGERIADETDWVRIEIEAALAKNIPVIPVLIDNSRMPKPDELPEGLRNFAFRQAAGVDTDHFRPHMDRLISSIDQHLVRLQAAAAPARTPSAGPAEAPACPGASRDDLWDRRTRFFQRRPAHFKIADPGDQFIAAVMDLDDFEPQVVHP